MKASSHSALINVLILTILLVGSSCSSSSDDSAKTIIGWSIDKDDIQKYLEQELDDKRRKSLSVGLVNDGELVYTYHNGTLGMNSNELANDNSIFNLGAGSRPIVYYFIMTLVEEGRLDLDTPLSDYLDIPELSEDPSIKKFTARSVLANKSGLKMDSSKGEDGFVGYTIAPGTESTDATVGYNYLMRAIIEKEQINLYQLKSIFQDKVASPLGMANTQFIFETDSVSANQKFELQTTMVDYSNWMIGVMNGVGLSEEGMETLLEPLEGTEDTDSSDLANLAIGGYNFFTNTGVSGDLSRYVSFDRNIKWGLLVFSDSIYAAEIGVATMLYLIIGPKINLIFAVIGLLTLAIAIGFFYGLYKLYKFIMD